MRVYFIRSRYLISITSWWQARRRSFVSSLNVIFAEKFTFATSRRGHSLRSRVAAGTGDDVALIKSPSLYFFFLLPLCLNEVQFTEGFQLSGAFGQSSGYPRLSNVTCRSHEIIIFPRLSGIYCQRLFCINQFQNSKGALWVYIHF